MGIRLAQELVGLESSGTPTFHFPHRTALVAAVAAEGFRRLATFLEESVERTDRDSPRAITAAMRYVEWAARQPALFATMYDPALAPDLELMWRRPEADQMDVLTARFAQNERAAIKYRASFLELYEEKALTLAIFLEQVAAGVRMRELRDDVSPTELTRALVAMADGLAWQLVNERQGTLDDLLGHARRCLALLVEGVGPRPTAR